jgi:hypothetical protein
MKESETIKEYSDRLFGIVNKVRLLGISFTDFRIVEKILVTVPKKYEASITTLENTKDLSKITLAELLNALQAQEQRRLMRQAHFTEGALQVQYLDSNKKKLKKKNQASSSNKTTASQFQGKGKFIKRNFSPCQHYNKICHPPFKCWKRPDARCSKCNQLGHEAIICKTKPQKQEEDAQVASQDDEDQMFVAMCFSVQTSSNHWLIDNGCTNHMAFDKSLFKTLQSTEVAKVKFENGDCIAAKGKGTIVITTNSGTKTIFDVLMYLI